MARGDTQPGGVGLGADRGRPEEGALLEPLRHGPVDHVGYLLAPEDADDLIDLGHFIEQLGLFPFRQAAGHDDAADLALLFEAQHFADDGQRLLPGRLDKAAGVDDDHVGPLGLGDERVAGLGQGAQHSLGVNEVLGTAEADESERPFGGVGHEQGCLIR